MAFSVLNAPVTGAGIVETESVAFSLLNAPVTGAGILETASVPFSVLNAPVNGSGILEIETVPFSVLNAPLGSAGITQVETYFKVRNDLEIRKHYLQGRFGAIPFLGDLDGLMKGQDETA